MLLEEVKDQLSEIVYSKYQSDAYMISSCSDSEYSEALSNELVLRIDQLSYCSTFKCNNPDS